MRKQTWRPVRLGRDLRVSGLAAPLRSLDREVLVALRSGGASPPTRGRGRSLLPALKRASAPVPIRVPGLRDAESEQVASEYFYHLSDDRADDPRAGSIVRIVASGRFVRQACDRRLARGRVTVNHRGRNYPPCRRLRFAKSASASRSPECGGTRAPWYPRRGGRSAIPATGLSRGERRAGFGARAAQGKRPWRRRWARSYTVLTPGRGWQGPNATNTQTSSRCVSRASCTTMPKGRSDAAASPNGR